MAEFQLNKPVITNEPRVTVDPGLEPGKYRFQLVVEDDDGNQSKAKEVIVTIVPNS